MDNNIFGNLRTAVKVYFSSDIVIAKNQIHHGCSFGVVIESARDCVIQNNDIHHNELAGELLSYIYNPTEL